MHSFATALEQAGHQTLHLTLDDTKGFTLIELILHICAQKQIQVFEYQQADEHRLLEQMGRLELELNKVGVGTHRASSEHFLVGFEEISDYFNPDKKQRMETFYRKMRKRYHILLDDEGEPEGGKWNYDTDNRQKLSKGAIDELPKPLLFSNDVTDINQRIARHQIHSIGQGNDTLLWPVNREQSLQLLDFFVATA
ncbi:protein related to deoxyribodipyrimidine photolyase [Vibrio ishigakensis]|uniref:Protein related to deoxyribodipyrimidine photolyase n=1 Tax=Vibrio ishigakensis TaxID=1481914 RepID=A0A0B8QE75_9VIBR|nr:protein related to deoxyribodipyrimidine photolyase [Vibrio ishigakensis]